MAPGNQDRSLTIPPGRVQIGIHESWASSTRMLIRKVTTTPDTQSVEYISSRSGGTSRSHTIPLWSPFLGSLLFSTVRFPCTLWTHQHSGRALSSPTAMGDSWSWSEHESDVGPVTGDDVREFESSGYQA